MTAAPAGLRIRPRRPESDTEVVRQLIRRAWLHSYAHIFSAAEVEASFQSSLPQGGSWMRGSRPEGSALVAEDHGVVVGFCRYSPVAHDGAPGVGEVTHLYVEPRWQSRGVGRALWRRALEELRRQGCSAVVVWTLERARSTRFYAAMGGAAMAQGSFHVGEHHEAAVCYRFELDAGATPP